MRDIGIAFPICPFWGRLGRDQMVVGFRTTVDSRYLEFDGTMEKIRVNRSSSFHKIQRI
jgi:hypothetical protein